MSNTASSRVAIILFNLGGPDKPEAVKPFLFNLFNDKAIISAPQPIRWLIAKLISSRRAPIAQEIYQELGGGSPLLPNTLEQAKTLDKILLESSEYEFKSFVSMRYWHPFSSKIVQDVKKWQPDKIVLLPLYPQFSTTTSESSILDWKAQAKKYSLDIPTSSVCCYPTLDGFIEAQADLVREKLKEIKKQGISSDLRVIYTAHGLPKKVVEAGDPYKHQVELTASAIAKKIEAELSEFQNSDWICSYQSRVGPLEWIKPYTEDEIEEASKKNKNLIIVPIAFVSEHSETLVELDIEYKELAEEHGAASYHRVSTVQTHPKFIAGLAEIVLNMTNDMQEVKSACGSKICPSHCKRCIFK